ncbi:MULTISPECIES: hypothetical protein [unclassified Wenzhouxiangella]|uniref:hypothetical protein n=1 Tax=unclassified Wenzhouxiangella TaxID=2613841 RepID=UPI000E399986|nr:MULTISPECIES: hypothetical protein [unclassified Wenzhouxiangella]RFF26982.1 hypothetical protein DZK25_10290 [Wenzhouxiangella sp. 15181]
MLLVLVIAAWAVSRLMYPTEAQREAIAEMEQHPDFSGENAFALLWTLARDVPEDRLDEVMAEDVRRFSEIPANPNMDEGKTWGIESVAEDYPDLTPTPEDRERFCRPRGDDCLARVREELEAYTALVERNQKLLDRIEALRDYDYVRFEFPYRVYTPLPSYQNVFLLRTRHAVAFAQGRKREAVAATCRDINTWRRLGAHSDNLITRLISVANSTDNHGHMLAKMLGELPVDMPLPEACDDALAPPSFVDVSICNAMYGEFKTSANSIRNLPEPMDQGGFLDRLSRPLLFDAEATVGTSAKQLRSFCGESERDRLRADRREIPESSSQGMLRFACVANSIGCMMNSIALPSYTDYRHRLQDHGAKLRVLGSLAWMRRHADDGRSPSELLAARPDDLKSPARDIGFGPEGRTLRVPLYDTTRGEYWSIPLPPALHAES